MSKKNRKISALIVLTLIVSLFATACGSKNEEEVTTSESVVTTDIAEVEEIEGDAKSYLTGLPIEEELLEYRPLAVMVENTSAAVPHYEINKAGVIYECPVEGGITRYMAMLDDYRDLERFGNLRSSRPYYQYFAVEYDAVYVHMGGNVPALDLIEKGFIQSFNGIDGLHNDTFYTTSDRKRPHNTYISTKGIENGFEKTGFEKKYTNEASSHFTFASSSEPNLLSDGEDVEVIKLYFFHNSPWFEYDEDSKTYKRFEFGKPEVDAVDGEQMAYTNIIFQDIDSSFYDGSEYLYINTVGQGTGKYFTNGKMVDIKWYKENDYSVTHYIYENGEEIELNPGKTWVCLVQNAYKDKNEFYKTKEEFEKSK